MGCEGYKGVPFCEVLVAVLPNEALSWDIMSEVFSKYDIWVLHCENVFHCASVNNWEK